MMIRKGAATAMLLLLPATLRADVSYESTTQMTGGTLIDMLKSTPFVPPSMKAMLQPETTITIVHGNQKAVINKERTEFYDIDKETITRLDNAKKTYTVMTFAQMREMIKEMPQKMAEGEAKIKQAQAQAAPQNGTQPTYTVTADTQVKNPGVTKVVNGLNAEERVITLTTKVTMTNPPPNTPAGTPTSMTYVVTTDVWIAPEPPEMKEAKDFDVRMYTKIAQGLDSQALMEQWKAAGNNMAAGMGMMFASKPGASDAMAQMEKEIAKMNGIRVLEVTSMSSPDMPAAPAGAAAPPPPSGSSVAGQVATDTATQTAAGESSKLGVFGNALSNSALGAFKRKPKPAPAAAPAAAPTAGTPGAATGGAVLMSTTTQKTNFSREPAPASAFQIPAGFKQVQPQNGFF